jgi:hypothetical protein
MTRGGKRPRAGGQFKFNGLPTKPVRVPIQFEQQVIEFAQQLANQADDTERFTRAYQDHGRGYVPIHWLRDRLNISTDRFNDILKRFAENDTIILQGGDPSSLTDQQIKNSFTDDQGYLRIAITWRKEGI